MIASQHLAAPNPEPGDAGVIPVACESEHVTVAALHLEDDRRLLHSLEMLQDIAQLSGALEIERLGSQIDPVAHASHHFVSTAVEKEQDFIDHGAVLLPRLQQHARRLAPPDVIIETRALGHLRLTPR